MLAINLTLPTTRDEVKQVPCLTKNWRPLAISRLNDGQIDQKQPIMEGVCIKNRKTN